MDGEGPEPGTTGDHPSESDAVVTAGRWSIIAATALGGSHRLDGRVNQDAHRVRVRGGVAAIVVADGHGSEASFRSDRGARFATTVGPWLADAIVAARTNAPDRIARRVPELVGQMVRRWQELVRLDERSDPMEPTARTSDGDLFRAYGTTFLLAVLDSSGAVFVQIGDGDIAVRDAEGRSWCPVPGDDRLLANETTSLCHVDLARDVRVGVLDGDQHALEVVTMSTDGYGNAFEDEQWQPSVTADLASLAASDGAGWIAHHLPEWCEDAAMIAGDDVTVAVALANLPGGRVTTERGGST